MKSFTKLMGVAIFSSLFTLAIFYLFVFESTKIESFDQGDSVPKIIPTTYTYTDSKTSAEVTDFTEVAEAVVNKVVHIRTTKELQRTWYRRSYSPSVVGSGVIVSPDGFILTNYHVVENNTDLEVTLNDNRTFKAKMVKADPETDLAVLKIETDIPLPYIVFGNSDVTRIGEWVLAVGNPLNLNSTVTAGIISAKSRDSNVWDSKNEAFIQTDAAVNMGNSGGALVNTRGELIGINTKISTQTGGYVGYSFAIPSNIVRKVFEDLMEYGGIQRGVLGVYGSQLNGKRAEELDLIDTEGFYINEVIENSGAEIAGLKPGDIIKSIEGNKINNYADLHGYLFSRRPGDKVAITYKRGTKINSMNITLSKSITEVIGNLEFRNLSDELKKKYGIDGGVLISDVSSNYLAEYIDYIALEINDYKIRSLEDIRNFKSKDVSLNTIKALSPDGEEVKLIF